MLIVLRYFGGRLQVSNGSSGYPGTLQCLDFQQWRCTYCLTLCPTKADLARHLLMKTYSSTYPGTLQCPICQMDFVKLSEPVGHCGSKNCRVQGHPDDIYGPIVNYLEQVLADWRPDAYQEPRIEYHMGYNRVSPKMMVHVVELPSTRATMVHVVGEPSIRAASSSNVNGKSPDKTGTIFPCSTLASRERPASFLGPRGGQLHIWPGG